MSFFIDYWDEMHFIVEISQYRLTQNEWIFIQKRTNYPAAYALITF